jgi:FMN reductase
VTPRIYIVDCSPDGGGRTRAALDAVSAAALGAGAAADTGWAGDTSAPLESTVDALASADGIVFGSPVYRASYANPLKRLLDSVPRGGEEHVDSPLAGKAVGIVLTGASLHHFLALGGLRDVLAGFFAAHVLPPGLYVPAAGFDASRKLVQPFAGQAASLGAAVAELASVLAHNQVLNSLRPQA